MRCFSGAKKIIMVLLTAGVTTAAHAQTIKQADGAPDTCRGIVTDRLSSRDLNTWQAIEQVIIAEDDGKSLHPILKHLYEQLQNSGHTIHVEFVPPSQHDYIAGEFWIEHFDPQGSDHVANIKLHLATIDRAAQKTIQIENDSFELASLTKMDRYAEVFGHEMAHAVDILFDLQRARLMYEFVESTGPMVHESVLSRSVEDRGLKLMIQQRDAVLDQFEVSAERIEMGIWHELVAGHKRHKAAKIIGNPEPQDFGKTKQPDRKV